MSTETKSKSIQMMEQREYEMAVTFIDHVKKNNDENYLKKSIPCRWENGSFVVQVTHISQRMVTIMEAMSRLHETQVSIFPKGDFIEILIR